MSCTLTLVWTATGRSESLSVDPASTTVGNLTEWATALFGQTGALQLSKEGRLLSAPSQTLQQAGLINGDLVAVARPAPPPAAAAAAAGGGGLDFSSLLAGGRPPTAASPPAAPTRTTPVYYPGMNLDDAIQYNPHPAALASLLLSKGHLMKELNYHNPRLAAELQRPGLTTEQAADIWRNEMVKGGIQSAMRASEKYHKERDMKRRLAENPNDAEAAAYFRKQDAQKLVDQQYRHMMEEYPESMGRVLMLYVEAKINGHQIQAFCDSGAQTTIMSKKVAMECGLADYIDERFAGMAVGVGTGKILGRIHMVQLEIGSGYHFPCSVTVMDDPAKGASEMPFLLGLDMMKRHTCQIDLEKGVLRFRLEPGKYMETPFLHEKDLSESQGGTKGFDAAKANEDLMKRIAEAEEKDRQEKK